MQIPVHPDCFAVIDAADFPIVAGIKWKAFHHGRTTYAMAPDGSFMHRHIMGCVPKDGKRVDHRDHNGLNNTRVNLRIGTQSQNCANQQRRIGTESGFKGVRRIKSSRINPWTATISKRTNGIQTRYHLGCFPTPELAARAYDAKAVELFGEFACCNFGPSSFFASSTNNTPLTERRAA